MNRTKLSGYLLIVNTILLFSSFEVVSRTISHLYSPLYLNALRFGIGGCVLFAVLMIRGDARLPARDLVWTALLGILNVGISMNLLQASLSLHGSSAALSAVLFSTNPVFVVLFASLSGTERIDLRIVMPLILCVAGVFLIFSDQLLLREAPLLPAVLALGSSAVFGLYTVLAGRISKRIGSLRMNAYTFLFGSILCAVGLVLFRPEVIVPLQDGSLQILYIGVAVTGVAYLTYFKGLVVVGTGRGSMIFFAKPVIATVLAALFLSETITLSFVIG
ncbi:MAG: DMT family transporter, partial [Spirochaetota bacterium]